MSKLKYVAPSTHILEIQVDSWFCQSAGAGLGDLDDENNEIG